MTSITPEEAWRGVKPLVEHFRVFGCMTHVLVPDAKRTKLENKSFICVLLRSVRSPKPTSCMTLSLKGLKSVGMWCLRKTNSEIGMQAMKSNC